MLASPDDVARTAAVDFARGMAAFWQAWLGARLLGGYLIGSLGQRMRSNVVTTAPIPSLLSPHGWHCRAKSTPVRDSSLRSREYNTAGRFSGNGRSLPQGTARGAGTD
jgi:hypothetical protein